MGIMVDDYFDSEINYIYTPHGALDDPLDFEDDIDNGCIEPITEKSEL